jgi:hypothetical protein
LTKLGTGEAEVARKQPSFSWLLKPNESLDQVIAGKNFELQFASDLLSKGPQGVDPILYVKW